MNQRFCFCNQLQEKSKIYERDRSNRVYESFQKRNKSVDRRHFEQGIIENGQIQEMLIKIDKEINRCIFISY